MKWFLQNLKSWKLWVAIAGGAIAIVLIIWGIITLTKDEEKLPTPTGLEIVMTSDKSIYISVDKNEDVFQYKFSIKVNDGSVQTITNSSNSIDITSYINNMGVINAKCMYLGKTAAGNSPYSQEINYNATVKIAQPKITLNQTENKLKFLLEDSFIESVPVDFVIFYGLNNQNSTFTFKNKTNGINDALVIVSSTNNNGSVSGYFDLLKVFKNESFDSGFTSGQTVSISLYVHSTNPFYKDSEISTQINYQIP